MTVAPSWNHLYGQPLDTPSTCHHRQRTALNHQTLFETCRDPSTQRTLCKYTLPKELYQLVFAASYVHLSDLEGDLIVVSTLGQISPIHNVHHDVLLGQERFTVDQPIQQLRLIQSCLAANFCRQSCVLGVSSTAGTFSTASNSSSSIDQSYNCL